MSGINKTIYNPKQNDPIRLLSRQEIMDMLGIKNIRTFNRMISDGLQCVKIGRKIYVPVDKYNEWIKRKCL